MSWLLLGVLATALAGDKDGDDPLVRARVSGHVKSFALATLPYEHPLLASEATGQGIVDTRLNLTLDIGPWFTFEAAHAVTATLGVVGEAGLPTQSGVGLEAPEAIPLTWRAFGDGGLSVLGRTDRLVFRVRPKGFSVAVGRQPISFGSGLFFTPMDLISPFTPATIDSEYKPGVDAFRFDAYAGLSTQVTVVAAYLGSWDLPGVALAVHGRTTVGVTDLALMYGYVRRDHVVGASMVSALGPVGIHADAVGTVPPDGADPFFRGVLGLDARPTGTTTLSGEVYVQTVGSTDPSELIELLGSERWARRELWLTGLVYGAVALSQEIVPTLNGSLAIFGNLTDPSMLLSATLAWSVSNNTDVAVGGYAGVGERPGDGSDAEPALPAFDTRSEFGTYPGILFVQMKAYW